MIDIAGSQETTRMFLRTEGDFSVYVPRKKRDSERGGIPTPFHYHSSSLINLHAGFSKDLASKVENNVAFLPNDVTHQL